jgi:hypothetical protein
MFMPRISGMKRRELSDAAMVTMPEAVMSNSW